MINAAVGASPAVRRAGTTGIMQAFFDELFNHIDAYSRYVPPSEAGEDREQRTGRAGIGIGLTQSGKTVAVADVIRDGPAAAAGVRPGDTIVAVDGESVRGWDVGAVAAGDDGLVRHAAEEPQRARELGQDLLQLALPVRHGGQFQLGPRQVRGGRQQVQERDFRLLHDGRRRRVVDQGVVDALGERFLVRPDAATRVSLRVHVHQEHPPFRHSQRSGEIDSRSGLSHPALLIRYTDDLCHR